MENSSRYLLNEFNLTQINKTFTLITNKKTRNIISIGPLQTYQHTINFIQVSIQSRKINILINCIRKQYIQWLLINGIVMRRTYQNRKSILIFIVLCIVFLFYIRSNIKPISDSRNSFNNAIKSIVFRLLFQITMIKLNVPLLYNFISYKLNLQIFQQQKEIQKTILLRITFRNEQIKTNLIYHKKINLQINKTNLKLDSELKQVLNFKYHSFRQTIKISITAIQDILTKQYNSQAKLYALRFLKDCFQMGSKGFIKYTDQILLPLLLKIVIDSTDQSAITKYAGSSYTKSSDLTKFKSIIISFFMLSKECVMKWAQWIANSEFKFYSSFLELQKKGVKFDSQTKYFRIQNQVNFKNNSKKNGLKLTQRKKIQQPIKQIINTQLIKDINLVNKPKIQQKQTIKHYQQKQQKQQNFKLSHRIKHQSKNDYIIKCHKLIKQHDQKLLKGEMNDKNLSQMNNKINDLLGEYMTTPQLDQKLMQMQIQTIFTNIKNLTEDCNNYKQFKIQKKQNQLKQSVLKTQNKQAKQQTKTNQQANESEQLSKPKLQKNNTMKKTEQISQVKKKQIQSQKKVPNIKIFDEQDKQEVKQTYNLSAKKSSNPLPKTEQIKTIQSIKTQNNTQSNNFKQQFKNVPNSINSKTETQNKIKQEKQNQNIIKIQDKNVNIKNETKTKLELNKASQPSQSSLSLLINEKDLQLNNHKQQIGLYNKSHKKQQSNNKINNNNNKITILKKNNNNEQSKSRKSSSIISIQNQNKKIQTFDSKLQLSNSQSSRVNFTNLSSSDDEESDHSRVNNNINLITNNKQKQKQNKILSAIPEEQNQVFTSRNQFYSPKIQIKSSSLPSYQIKQSKQKQTIYVDKSTTQSLPPHLIKQYESKIRQLQLKLQQKTQSDRRMQIRLNELNRLKQVQQQQLYKIKQQNHKIIKQFSNCVNAEEYQEVKKQFNQIKLKNKKMEDKMEKLLKEIDSLKKQKQHSLIHAKQHQQNLALIQQKQKLLDLLKQSKATSRVNHQNYSQQKQLIFSSSIKQSSMNLKSPQKLNYRIQHLHQDYKTNKTHFSQLKYWMNQNNLYLLKRSILRRQQLFYTSQLISIASRCQYYQNQAMTLKVELSFQLNTLKHFKPEVKIFNIEQIDIWKKKIIGEESLYHQEIIAKAKKFPFKLIKMQIQLSEHQKIQVLLPLVYYNFLRSTQIKDQEFDKLLEEKKQNIIKSKIFNLNSKIIKDFSSLVQCQPFYKTKNNNKIRFKIYEKSQKQNVFFGQITNLSKQKCFMKVIPQPFNQQMYIKAEELIQNFIFILSG